MTGILNIILFIIILLIIDTYVLSGLKALAAKSRLIRKKEFSRSLFYLLSLADHGIIIGDLH